jgi:hypothetical protein
MSGPTPPTTGPSSVDRPKKRRLRDAPGWVLIVIAILAVLLVPLGVFAVANYITNQTTVTIDDMAWALTYAPGATGYLPICGFGGTGNCPSHVHPGSDFTGSVLISGYYAGKNVGLSAPSPFRLISTDPTLPAVVSAPGLLISVDLQLPQSAGEYSFTGTVTFS